MKNNEDRSTSLSFFFLARLAHSHKNRKSERRAQNLNVVASRRRWRWRRSGGIAPSPSSLLHLLMTAQTTATVTISEAGAGAAAAKGSRVGAAVDEPRRRWRIEAASCARASSSSAVPTSQASARYVLVWKCLLSPPPLSELRTTIDSRERSETEPREIDLSF